MRATFRRLLAILDGTPTGARGQSLVELTLTLPILLVMLLGLAEIGWYANNYLTLLDVVREAGRVGASSVRDPMDWPIGDELKYYRMDCEDDPDFLEKQATDNNTEWLGPSDLVNWGFIATTASDRPFGYYDYVACTVIGNMAPLKFDDKKDDIAISVFSFFVLNQGTAAATVRVYGRYPARANECEINDPYDPFDWNRDGAGNGYGEAGEPYYDPGSDNIRGYVFRGNHRMNFPGASQQCLGSSFSVMDVEKLLDFTGDPDRTRKIEQTTNYGLVLAEIFWSHRQLFGLPWFNIGPLEDGQTIHVWAFFPVSAAEPDIDF